jgi:biopolymer transport protein ExbD
MKPMTRIMIPFMISILLGLMIPLMAASSCEPQETEVSDVKVEPVQQTTNSEIKIITIEGHDYILWENNPNHQENVGGICHSESCSAYHAYNTN